MTDINKILETRSNVHGDFTDYSTIMSRFDVIMAEAPQANKLTAVQTQAVRMILSKVTRILCGDPDHLDHWVDIQGYAKLAEYKSGPHETI